MLLMVEKGVRCLQICKASNKYIKDYDKNKESIYIPYWYVNKFYGWATH